MTTEAHETFERTNGAAGADPSRSPARGRGDAGRGAGGELVALKPARLPSAAASEAAALISLIERLATDPNVDVERVERMYAMYERAAARNARAAYDEALAQMQHELPTIAKKGAIKHGDKLIAKYALWEDIVPAVMPVLGQHGFSLTFRITGDDRTMTITGILAHREGHREETTITLPHDTGPGRNAVQARGSSTSYGKRYVAGALLNLVSAEERDDDGNAAQAPATVTPEQIAKIEAELKKTGGNVDKFCAHYKVETIADLPAAKYAGALAAIARSAAARGGA